MVKTALQGFNRLGSLSLVWASSNYQGTIGPKMKSQLKHPFKSPKHFLGAQASSRWMSPSPGTTSRPFGILSKQKKSIWKSWTSLLLRAT
jgi:hypothetical protein